jgi:hypothetical protein
MTARVPLEEFERNKSKSWLCDKHRRAIWSLNTGRQAYLVAGVGTSLRCWLSKAIRTGKRWAMRERSTARDTNLEEFKQFYLLVG